MAIEDEKKNLVLEYLELIDISSEDDFLIAYPFYDSLDDLRLSVKLDNINALFGSANSSENENSKQVNHERNLLTNSESSNRGRRPSFLRRSLAWDSAFFTSAGVLDQEELRVVNKGFNNAAEAYLLPGIQEDIRTRRSDESECMYDSDDGFRINSLDCDPFEDVRASIDKSNKKLQLGKSTLHKFRSYKKVDIADRNRVKSTPTSKSQSNIKTQRLESYKREPRTPRSGESNIKILKPHKLSGGASTMSARTIQRASLGSYNVKSGYNKTKRSESVQNLKMFKSATPTLKSCSKFSLTASASSAFSLSSYDTAPSSSSSKYSFNSTRRKLDSRSNTLDSPGFSLISNNNSSQTSPCCSSFDNGFSLESNYSSTPLNNLSSRAQSSTSQEIQENSSKRNLKPSALRMPSPKIGFFDEKSVGGNVKFQFGLHKANSDVVSRSAEYSSRIRAKKGTNVQQQDNDSPLLSAKVKTSRKCPVSDSKSRSHTDLSPVLERGSCSKIRKVGSGERDRRNVCKPSSLKSEETRIKGTMKKNTITKSKGKRDDSAKSYRENEKENVSNVEELSRHFEAIDISKDNHENATVPRPSSPLLGPTRMGFSVGTRTPLADRSFVWNRRASRDKSA